MKTWGSDLQQGWKGSSVVQITDFSHREPKLIPRANMEAQDHL